MYRDPSNQSPLRTRCAGSPLVTPGFGGAVEIIDDTCGKLTTPEDPSAVAVALAVLIRDPSRQQALSHSGPLRAESLSGLPGRMDAAAKIFGSLIEQQTKPEVSGCD